MAESGTAERTTGKREYMAKKPKAPGRRYRAGKIMEKEGVTLEEAFERGREQDARNPAAKKRKGTPKLTPVARQARKQLLPRGKGPVSFVGGGSPGLGRKK